MNRKVIGGLMRGLDVELAFAEGLDLLTEREDRDCAARLRVVTKRLPPARRRHRTWSGEFSTKPARVAPSPIRQLTSKST